MSVDLLFYEPRLAVPILTRIDDAAAAYRRKFGQSATVARCCPDERPPGLRWHAGMAILADPAVQPGYLVLGTPQ